MLLELNIENIALIESLRIEFGQGLNVLTGETGSGKSHQIVHPLYGHLRE